MAGEKSVIAPVMPPPPEPSLWQWFAGGSVGYLVDAEEEMYTLHVGVDLPSQLAGWDQALYLEVGYADADLSYMSSGCDPNYPTACMPVVSTYKIETIPVTVNYKLERALTETLNMYIGVGVGAANIDVSSSGFSDDEWAFYAQVFAGLLYNVNESCEIYCGGRWIYVDDYTIGGSSMADSDDWMVEIGGRINL